MPQTTNQINKYALLRNEVFPAMSVNKEVTDITNSSPPGHSERRRVLTSTAIRLLSVLTGNPEELRM